MSELFKKLPIAEKMWAEDKNPDDYDADSDEILRWRCECGEYIYRAICNLEKDHLCQKCKKEKSRLTNHPELLKLWDYEKNNIDPHEVSIKSDKGYYFKCEKGHSKIRKMRAVAKKPECPVCNMDTIAKNPDMLKFWDYEANKDIDIETTSSNSSTVVWWKCPNCGHRWPAEIVTRKLSKNQCPCCDVKTVVKPGFNDFFTVYPELKDDFNDTYNPLDEGVSSRRPTKWKCHLCGHEWETFLSSRVVNGRFTKCPVCAGRKRTKSYAEQYPELAECYSPNNAVPLSEIVSSRDVRESYLWICPTHGEFDQTIEAMIRSMNTFAKGCPFCASKRVKYEDSFGYLHPELIEEYSNANTADIFNVTAKSGIEAKWKCKNCGHEWSATFYTRHEGFGRCPKCYPNPRYKRMLYEERPDLEHYYRGKRNFKTYSFQSNVKVPWECDEGHHFDLEIFRMVKDHDEFYCPVCAETRLVVGVNDFASNYPELAKEWSPSNERKPEEYFKSSVLRVKWICPNCTHEYEASLDEKVNGYSCPVCDGRLTVVGKNDLATTHPKLAREYASNNTIELSKIRKELKIPVWWICSKCGGNFRASPNEREEDDNSCPFCSGKKVLAGFNDLKTLKPTLYGRLAKPYKEAYPTIPYKPNNSPLWECPTCHGEYTDTIENVENGINNCPYCAGEKLLTGFNDLKTLYPELESKWSKSNPPMDTILPKYVSTYKWICPICGGEHGATIQERLNGEDDCPYCAGRKVLAGFNDLKTLRPELYEKVAKSYKEIYPVFMYKRENYIVWECQTCHGDYSASIGDIEDGLEKCPYCAGKKVLPGFNDFPTVHPELIERLAPSLREKLDIVPCNDEIYLKWICPTCNGEYYDSVKNIIDGVNNCPFCAGRKLLTGFNDLTSVHPELVEKLSLELRQTADQIICKNDKYLKWICYTCGGEYPDSIQNILNGEDNCPYCAGKKVSVGYNDLTTTHPNLVKEWAIENYLTKVKGPERYTAKKRKRVWWRCPKCDEGYKMPIDDKVIATKRGHETCPKCKGRLRNKLIYTPLK